MGKVVNFLLHFALEVKCQRIQCGEGKINYFSLIKLFISPTPRTEKSQLMMSNMLSLSRDSLLSDECVYGGRTDGVSASSVSDAGPFLPNQSPPVRASSLSMYRGAILSGQLPLKTAALCPPTRMYGTVLCEIIHLIMG